MYHGFEHGQRKCIIKDPYFKRMNFFRKAFTYIKNLCIVWHYRLKISRYAPTKLRNSEIFMEYYRRTRPDSEVFTLDFYEGFKLECRAPDLSAVAETCVLEDYVPLAKFAMRPGIIVLDVGANIGDYSVWAAWHGARVYAFEPELGNVEKLQKNVELNNLQTAITVVPQAVYSYTGHVALTVSNQSAGGHIVGNGSASGVACITLEDFLTGQHIPSVDILKIDVEGAEYEIFAHVLPDTFGKIKAIVGEYHLGVGPEPNFETLRQLLTPHYTHVNSYYPFYFYAYND